MTTLHLRHLLHSAGGLFALLTLSAPVVAQTPARDPSARLAEVLPAEVSARVLARIAEARARELPSQALENRAVELAVKGLPPETVERAVNEHASRLERARAALARGGREDPSDTDTESAELAMSAGVDGSAVSALAKSAPSGSSLAVPLFVLTSHLARGLPSDAAIERVLAAMQARAAERAARVHPGKGNSATGVPADIPTNGGRGNRPTSPRGKGNGRES